MGDETDRNQDTQRDLHGVVRVAWNPLLPGLIASYAAEGWFVHLMSRHGDFVQTGEAVKFAVSGILAGIFYWVGARQLSRINLPGRQSAWIFWSATVILRLAILPVVPGDDLWRYRWEGMIQLHGFNPYLTNPDSPLLAHLRNADWLKINHRNYAAIYPPLTQAIFAGMAAFGNAVWGYQLLFALADLAGIAVLRRMLTRSGAAANGAVWYAWNPLTVYAFAGAAHFDSLMILALLGAVCALDESVRRRTRPSVGGDSPGISSLDWISALLLGLAIAVKIAPLTLLPVWAFAVPSWRRLPGLLTLSIAPLTLSAFVYGFPGTPVFATLRQFGGSFRVNDPIWWLVEAAGWPNSTVNNGFYGVCALVVCLALACWFRHDWRRGLLWVWGATLLLSPVVHAWYVAWVLPLAAWRGKGARAWFVFSISTFGYFLLWEVNHASGKPWQEPVWLRLVILLPPLAAMMWMRWVPQSAASSGEEPPKPLNPRGSTTTI